MPGTDPPDRSFASVHPREGIVVLGGMGGTGEAGEGVEHREHLGGWGARSTWEGRARGRFALSIAQQARYVQQMSMRRSRARRRRALERRTRCGAVYKAFTQ